jgi:hypothetical protein
MKRRMESTSRARAWRSRTITFTRYVDDRKGSHDMKTFALALLAGAGVLATSTAFAASPVVPAEQLGAANAATQVRMVCDEDGRCYRTRGQRRVVVQEGYSDGYAYAPRERYERRGYYDQGPSVGVGIGPGVGVGIGFGGGRERW